jgi:hypothetical protein
MLFYKRVPRAFCPLLEQAMASCPNLVPKLCNLRSDEGVKTGGLDVDSNLGWKGAELYVATVPQV